MNTLTEAEKGYLAGLLDGEGCIVISKTMRLKSTPNPVYHLQVVIAQANYEFLAYWKKKTGIGSLHHHPKITNTSLIEKYRLNQKDQYAWHISSCDANSLLLAIKEYLVLKKPQAEIALDFQSTMMDRKYCGRKGFRGGGQLPASVLAKREEFRLAIQYGNQHHSEEVASVTNLEEGDDPQIAMFKSD